MEAPPPRQVLLPPRLPADPRLENLQSERNEAAWHRKGWTPPDHESRDRKRAQSPLAQPPSIL